jgi:hypothetical protein
MQQAIRFSQLSPSLKTLVRLCQELNFGSILNLTVINGEVSFDPQPEVLVDVRLDEEVKPRAELELGEFILCEEVCRLLAQIDALQNGTIERIIVHGGLPRRMTIRRPLYPVTKRGGTEHDRNGS